MKKLLASLGFTLAALFASAVSVSSAFAQEVPCQWNYQNVAGVATATYCGNVISKGATNFASLPNIAALTAINVPFANETFSVNGYQGGLFTWIVGSLPCNPSTGGGDGGITFCTSDGQGGYLTSGYWKRQFSGPAYAEWFGITFNDPTTDQSASWNAMAADLASQSIPLYQDGQVYGMGFLLPSNFTMSCDNNAISGWAVTNNSAAGSVVSLANNLVSNLNIQHCGVFGNSSANTNVQDGLFIQNSTSIPQSPRDYFDDIFVHALTGRGIVLGTAIRDSFFVNMRSYFTGGFGFDIASNDIHIIGCNAGESATNGIHITASAMQISDCKSWGSGQYNAANVFSNYLFAGPGTGTSGDLIATNLFSQEATGAGFQWFRSGPSVQNGGIYTNLRSDGDGIAAAQSCFSVTFITNAILNGSCGKGGAGLAGTPAHALTLSSTSFGNTINLTADGNVSGVLYNGAPNAVGNTININGDGAAIQYVPYASSIVPNWAAGDTLIITDTGAIAMGIPTAPLDGKSITLVFACGAGCAVPTFNAIYAKDATFATSFSTTSGVTNSITFKYNSSASKWQQVGGGSYAVQ